MLPVPTGEMARGRKSRGHTGRRGGVIDKIDQIVETALSMVERQLIIYCYVYLNTRGSISVVVISPIAILSPALSRGSLVFDRQYVYIPDLNNRLYATSVYDKKLFHTRYTY